MSGVFCQFSPQDIIFVATDAHKLVRYRRTDTQASGGSSFILPKKPLNLLKSNLTGSEEVEIEYNESNAIFRFNDIVLICRLIDGKYPNYEAVIPKENPNVLVIDRAQFLSSLRRVSIFSNKTTHQVKLRLAGSELSLSAEDIDFANEANERLTCNYNGEDLEIGFNSRFLMEMLNNMDTPEVRLGMLWRTRSRSLPALTCLALHLEAVQLYQCAMPAANENPDEDILMLVMPVMLNR